LIQLGNPELVLALVQEHGGFDDEYEYTWGFNASFSAEQVRAMLAVDKRWISQLGGSLGVLDEHELVEWFRSGKKTARAIAAIKGIPSAVVDLAKQSTDKKCHEALMTHHQFTEQEIEAYMQDKTYNSLWDSIVSYQSSLSESQLLRLAGKKSLQWELFLREELHTEAVLRQLLKSKDSDLRARVTKKLGIDTAVGASTSPAKNTEEAELQDELLSLTNALALHGAPFSAVAAYKLLEELELISTGVDEFETKIRRTTKAGKQYASNNADNAVSFRQSRFAELLELMINQHEAKKAA